MTASIKSLFVSKLDREDLPADPSRRLLAELERAARMLATEDGAGIAWAHEHHYPGYTSYASLNDLPDRDPAFADLQNVLDGHVSAFARELDPDRGGRRLALDCLWVKVLPPGGFHTSHIHPHSVISGTIYVVVPNGASALRFEDPRLPMMMATPPCKAKAREDNCTFVSIEPRPGTILFWECFLRHEVPVNHGRCECITVGFNVRWE